jgi:hypothetical protein
VAPPVTPQDELKINIDEAKELKEAFVQEQVGAVEVNDDDAGFAPRGELDDSETRRQIAGLYKRK